jgi:hypothetical protein
VCSDLSCFLFCLGSHLGVYPVKSIQAGILAITESASIFANNIIRRDTDINSLDNDDMEIGSFNGNEYEKILSEAINKYYD